MMLRSSAHSGAQHAAFSIHAGIAFGIFGIAKLAKVAKARSGLMDYLATTEGTLDCVVMDVNVVPLEYGAQLMK